MDVEAKLLENGMYAVAINGFDNGAMYFDATRQEIRQMMKELSDQISITKDLIHKIVCPKTNSDQHGTIIGIIKDSDSVQVVWHEGLNKTHEHIDDLTVLS